MVELFEAFQITVGHLLIAGDGFCVVEEEAEHGANMIGGEWDAGFVSD